MAHPTPVALVGHHELQASQPVALLPPSPKVSGNNAEEKEPETRKPSKSVSVMEQKKMEFEDYVNSFLEWSEAQENLDVYQMNAFFAATHDWHYFALNYWKTVCAQFIQTAGLVILLYRDWSDILSTTFDSSGAAVEEEGRTLCDADGDLDLKLLAFFLVSFLSIRVGDQIANIARYGMYGWGADEVLVPFINWGWVAYGLIVNYITLVLSVFISAQVVYLSDTPLDMILNFVALYFIIELDDDMVTWQDYADVTDWFLGDRGMRDERKNGNDPGETPYEIWLKKLAVKSSDLDAAGVTDDDDDGYDDVTIYGRCGSGFNNCGKDVIRKGAFCRDTYKVKFLMLPFLVVLPLYVLICY